MSFLEEILEATRQSVAKRQSDRSVADLERNLPTRSDDRGFLRALQRPGMSVIAEFKRESPTQKRFSESPDLKEMVRAYERGDARAISVLTEPGKFGGSIEDLRSAREACDLPILCKDFIVDRYQLLEAAEAGADAVLLIVAAFAGEEDKLRELHNAARDLSLDVLIEVRSASERDKALEITDDLVGINNRDLDTFDIDHARTATLSRGISAKTTVVSESGINEVSDLESLLAAKVEAALIGTALMKADDPERACRAFSSVSSPHLSSAAA